MCSQVNALVPSDLIGGYRMPSNQNAGESVQYEVCVGVGTLSYDMTVTSSFGLARTSRTSGNIKASACTGNLCALEFSCSLLSGDDDDDDFGSGNRCYFSSSCFVFNRTGGVTYGSRTPTGTSNCNPNLNPSITQNLVRLSSYPQACSNSDNSVPAILGASAGAIIMCCVVACVAYRCSRGAARGAQSAGMAAAVGGVGGTGRIVRVRLAGGAVVSPNPAAVIVTAPVISPPGSSRGYSPAAALYAPPPPPAGTMAGYSPYGSATVSPPAGPYAGVPPAASMGYPPAPPAGPGGAKQAPWGAAPGAYPGAYASSAQPGEYAPAGAYPGAAPSNEYPGASAPSGAYPGAYASTAYPGATAPPPPDNRTAEKRNSWSDNSGFGL